VTAIYCFTSREGRRGKVDDHSFLPGSPVTSAREGGRGGGGATAGGDFSRGGGKGKAGFIISTIGSLKNRIIEGGGEKKKGKTQQINHLPNGKGKRKGKRKLLFSLILRTKPA